MIHVLYFDGTSRGNPGDASYGAVVYDQEGKELKSVEGVLGKTTTNVAEYCGLLYGMDMCSKMECKELVVRGDAKKVIQQVTNIIAVHEPKLQTIIQ